jgi:tetratricopeptide (TPR) repeat protein
MRKNYPLAVLFTFIVFQLSAQSPYMNAIPNGNSKKATVMEQVGLTDISISYHRPSVSGREGKIWGQLVHKGFINFGFGSNNPAPWRAGANENTIFECSNDITVEGKALPKGKYALFMAYDPAETIIIFSKKYDAWGSFFYDEKDDVLRVKVKPQALDKSIEWLRYEFSTQTENAAIIALEWEKLSIPFKIETDYLKHQFEAIGSELKNPRGFTWESLNRAAAWCLSKNYQLEQGLAWSKSSSDANGFGGAQSFTAISTTAQLLEKLGKKEEAATEMKRAMIVATMNELHQYGRQLITQKKPKEALEAFEQNYNKNPKQFTTYSGMARGYSANGDYTKALEFAKKALELAPNEANKTAMQGMIDKLKEGKDIN